MAQKLLHFLDGRVSEKSTASKEVAPLPVGTAVVVIVGVNIVLWSLIAIAIRSLI